MPNKFAVDQRVCVPSQLIPHGEREPYAMFVSPIMAIENRSVKVRLPRGLGESGWIATSKIHTDLGVALISIGDFATEKELLDPLTKSALHFCRLLLPDDRLTHVKCRSIREVGTWWCKNQVVYTHVILFGHGSRQGITFGVGGERPALSFAQWTKPLSTSPKAVLSLCCETGRAPFARDFSALDFCTSFIAPYQSVHGAVASQFLQSFLSLHLLQAKSLKVAFKLANDSLPGGQHFRLWIKGSITKAK